MRNNCIHRRTIIYGLTYWTGLIIRSRIYKVDAVCDRKAIYFNGEPAIHYLGLPVINIESIENDTDVMDELTILISVGNKKNVSDSIKKDIRKHNINANIIDIFEERTFFKNINVWRNHIYENARLVIDNNSDNNAVIISNKNSYAKYQGVFSFVEIMLGHIYDVRLAGFSPVIDLTYGIRTEKSAWSFEDDNSVNGWDVYFQQPDRICVDDIYKNFNVYELTNDCETAWSYRTYELFDLDEENLKLCNKIYVENIHLCERIRDKINNKRERLLGNGRVLGVAIRSEFRYGGELGVPLYNGHPIVGTVEDYINAIEERLKRWDYERFFLMVDDREYHDQIQKYFGNICLTIERALPHYFRNGIPINYEALIEQEDDKLCEFENVSLLQKTDDYIVETYLLSMCDSLYCSNGGAQAVAYMINGGNYLYYELDNRGRYKI